MLSDDSFQVKVNFVLPHSIREIERRHSTKISISKTCQYGVISGYGHHEGWLISVYVITDVCIYCGELRLSIGNVPQHERCSRHRWAEQSKAVLLFHAIGDTFEAAMQQAEEQAEKFLKDPGNWNWEIELFLSRYEFLKYRGGYEHEIEKLQAENKKLLSQIKEMESKTQVPFTGKIQAA